MKMWTGGWDKGMWSLFSVLVWPAVAGNVAWSLVSLALLGPTETSFWPRLTALAVLAVYLAVELVRVISLHEENPLPDSFWLGDALHSLTVIVLAHGLQGGAEWTAKAAGIFLLIGVIGHLFGCWDRERTSQRRWPRLTLAGINGVGLLLLWIFREQPWGVVIALSAVLVIWLIVRNTCSEFLDGKADGDSQDGGLQDADLKDAALKDAALKDADSQDAGSSS